MELEPIPYPDAQIAAILARVKTIAMVGASSNWSPDSVSWISAAAVVLT